VQVDLDTKLATVEVEAPNLIDAMNMLPSFVQVIKVRADTVWVRCTVLGGPANKLHRDDPAVPCALAAIWQPAKSAAVDAQPCLLLQSFH
jgi:hypothetical protein